MSIEFGAPVEWADDTRDFLRPPKPIAKPPRVERTPRAARLSVEESHAKAVERARRLQDLLRTRGGVTDAEYLLGPLMASANQLRSVVIGGHALIATESARDRVLSSLHLARQQLHAVVDAMRASDWLAGHEDTRGVNEKVRQAQATIDSVEQLLSDDAELRAESPESVGDAP